MADACEGIIDKPSMYEYGWGKDGLSYMIAISSDHIADVTPRYTRKFLTDNFQTRRRTHTTSENATVKIIYELNQELQRNLTRSSLEELRRRQQLEDAELQLCKQSTEWTQQEKYGRGRISGSLAWKESRQEAGKSVQDGDKSKRKDRQVAGFQIEAFSPPISDKLSLQIRPKPQGRHDGIMVAGTACAIGEADSISVVVVDEHCLGCILQSQSFVTWDDAKDFVKQLPSHRIIIINGKCEEDPRVKAIEMPRLGGWVKDDVVKKGVAFIGQVDAHPDWAYCSNLEDCPTEGCEVVLQVDPHRPTLKLRKERNALPSKVAGRLPDSVMPLEVQLQATEDEKREVVTSFLQSRQGRYAGYTTKPGTPIYFLDSTSYPLTRVDATALASASKTKSWSTFHFVPIPLVPEDKNDDEKSVALMTYDVPLETSFFNISLGTQLLTSNSSLVPTSNALHNARLVALYFSAHWCGPCRSFTPALSEMYAHLKDYRPFHGLEIVFVSSDRDTNSFTNYFGSMPWQAIPFEQLQSVKGALNSTYGVRGIPALVVLDAVTGQVVVPASESRRAVVTACSGGEKHIEALLDDWLQRVPQETKDLLSMLEESCREDGDGCHIDENKEIPYLVARPKSATPADTASRIKDFFETLIAEGNDPTSAAAKAIGLVADEQKLGHTLRPGPLDGKAVRKGPIQAIGRLDDALKRALECNSPGVVQEVLSISMKYLKNTTSEPWSPKYRSFKLSNKIADQITSVEGGLNLLQGLGFEISGTSQEFRATIPVSVNLDETNRTVTQLIEKLRCEP